MYLSSLRRRMLTGLFLLTAAPVLSGIAGLAQASEVGEPPRELRIGFQKSSVNLTLLKHRKALEERLKGVKVSWFEFTAGPQLLEALSVGSIDFGATGDTPPIFAQAAGSRLLYVGTEPAKPDNSAILVKQDSALRSLSDLKGKRVAFQRGSSAHYLTVRALQQSGLQWSDITPVYLAPADARAAFERGSVDAWAIWDPYWAAVEKTLNPRVLSTSRGLSGNHTFYLANRAYAEKHGAVLQLLFEELTLSDKLVVENRAEAVRIVAESIGLERDVVDTYLARRPRSPVGHLTEAVLDEQQAIADNFFSNQLIPRPIRIRDAVWQPTASQAEAASR